MEQKQCSDCGFVKPVTDFHRSFVTKAGVQRYFRYCKVCSGERRRAWYKNNIEYARERGRRVQQERRDAGLNQERERWYKILQKYGVTREEWETKFNSQGARCAICEKDLDPRKAHTDHCHQTGVVRGILCVDCNHGIGKFRDSYEILLKAAQYVNEYAAPAARLQGGDGE